MSEWLDLMLEEIARKRRERDEALPWEHLSCGVDRDWLWDEYEAALELCDRSSMYALTGAIFANDRGAASVAIAKLEHAAGNFYINDKPTGAVVGQQPFGGGRASGTNDKAGSAANLMRWVSTRTIKETFVPPTDFAYPFMEAE